MFPATFMSVLAVSDQAEQAVVTSTLILWRSMGMVLGVAMSSLVLQNALFYYLRELVTGPDRDKVSSIPFVPHYSETYQCLGHRRSPQISQSHPPPRARIPRTSHRFIRLFPASYLHNGCHVISRDDFTYLSVEVA